MYANKVNGHAAAGQHLTSNMDFFTITTSVDIKTVAANLDALVEVVALNGQPVIQGAVGGTGPFTINVAIEHVGAWASTTALKAAIDANPVFSGGTNAVAVFAF